MKFDRTQFIQKFTAETRDNIQKLNQAFLGLEKTPSDKNLLQEAMRVIHTVKGSARMLNVTPMSELAHAVEDVLQLASKGTATLTSALIDVLLSSLDGLSALLEAVPHNQEGHVDIQPLLQRLEAIQKNPGEAVSAITHKTAPEVLLAEPASTVPVKKSDKPIVLDKSAFITRFITEAEEHVRSITEAGTVLHQEPDNMTAAEKGFRAAHTLKGSARMLKFESTSSIAQRIETIYRQIWEKKSAWQPDYLNIITNTMQVIRRILTAIQQGGQESFKDVAILDLLDQVIEGQPVDAARIGATQAAIVQTGAHLETVVAGQELSPADSLGERLIQAGLITREQLFHVNRNSDARIPLGERLIAFGYISREQLSQILKEQKAAREMLGQKKFISVAESEPDKSPQALKTVAEEIRIRLDKLDALINAVGELITAQMRRDENIQDFRKLFTQTRRYSRLVQELIIRLRKSLPRNAEPEWSHLEEEVTLGGIRMLEQFEGLTKRSREDAAAFALLINEIQAIVMGMRMIALSTIFDAYPRAVRDLARNLGKEVELVIRGRETELDRKMVEKLNEPLIHLIRNAIDHGIETADVRRTLGKPPTGLLEIAARNEGTSIVIEIRDDGGGLDLDKIKSRALQKRLLPEDQAIDRLSENDIINLIFLPGFSTADFITDISGRGYGMDVVKQSVEELKGYLSVDSQRGRGTCFSIHLPLTLTSLHALFVRAGHSKFAFPIPSVAETLKINRSEIIEVIQKKAIRLRNQLIPILPLSDVMGVPLTESVPQDELFVIIAHASGERAGFIVDDIIEEKEVIVKSLPRHFHKIKTISSATIAGNNEIVFILHVPQLILTTREFSVTVASGAARKTAQTILVVDDSLNTREVEKTILQAYGYDVDTAKDGLDAMEKIRQKTYDLIVTDLEMPLMDGFTLTAQIRAEKNLQNIPVVIVTSRDSADDKRRGIEVGANAYIVKGSFDQTNLIDTVESLIG